MPGWANNHSGTLSALCVLKQMVKNCQDFSVIEPWLKAADTCIRLLECNGTSAETYLAATQFLKNLVYKSYQYKMICLKEGVVSKLVFLLKEHAGGEVISNLSSITACVMECLPVYQKCTTTIQNDDLLLVIGALQHHGTKGVSIVFNCLRTIRYILSKNKTALDSGYVRALTKQTLLVYSSMYLSRRYVQMEILKLIRVLTSEHPPTPGASSLDSAIVHQLVRIVHYHPMSSCISALACETASACLSTKDGSTFVVFASLPAAVAKAHYKRIQKGTRMQPQQCEAMCQLFQKVTEQHDPATAQNPLLQYRALVHVLASSNCSNYEVQAVFEIIRIV